MSLEHPQLSIKTLRSSVNQWLTKNCTGKEVILSISTGDTPIFSPKGTVPHSWHKITKEDYSLLEFPSNFYDIVIIYDALSILTPEHRKKFILEAARTLNNGGVILAITPACNDAEEVYNFMNSIGFDTTAFAKARLTNKELVGLRPTEAIFLEDSTVIPNRKRLVSYLKEMGFAVTLEELWTAGTRFPVKRLYAGLKWKKA